MSVRRTIIIPAILALSTFGSILTSATVATSAAHASSVHVVAAAPRTHYYA